jgi:hypothetical protein
MLPGYRIVCCCFRCRSPPLDPESCPRFGCRSMTLNPGPGEGYARVTCCTAPHGQENRPVTPSSITRSLIGLVLKTTLKRCPATTSVHAHIFRTRSNRLIACFVAQLRLARNAVRTTVCVPGERVGGIFFPVQDPTTRHAMRSILVKVQK